MSLAIPSAILASIVSLSVAITIMLRRPRRPLYSRFASFAFTLFLWHATAVASRFGAGTLVQLQVAAGLLLAPSALLFFAEVLRDHSPQTRNLGRAVSLVCVVLLAVDVLPIGQSFAARAIDTLYVLGTFAIVLHALYTRARAARAVPERNRLFYLLLGGLIAIVLALGELSIDNEIYAATGHVAVTFYVYFLYQSLVSQRVIDLVEFLGKTAVLGVLTIILATIYALLVLWAGTEQQGLWLFNTLVASFVILIFYDQVRPWIEEATAQLILRQRHDLRTAVRKLLRALRTTLRLDEMVAQVLDTLSNSGRAPHIAFYLPDESATAFVLRSYRGAQPPQNLSVAQQPSLLQELRRDRRPILLENLVDRYQDMPTSLTAADASSQRGQDRVGEAIATMRAMNANMLLPVVSGDQVLGLLTLGTETPTEGYSLEEIALLLSVAEACAVVVENSQEYERLRDRDRLVVMGEMATGIAHEIRNPLGAIKGAAQCLDPTALAPESAELVRVIIEETDRLNRVLGQFLEYARPLRANPVPTDTNAVVEATLRLLSADSLPSTITLQRSLGRELPKVTIDPEMLKQVLINLILNAGQAMPKGGTLSINTSLSRDATSEAFTTSRMARKHLVLRVADTGEGIKSEDLPKIFLPFFTTKPQGTGLGLAICNRIIQHAGGRIDVSSALGIGTTFTLRLPLAEPVPATEPTERPKP